MSRTSRPDVGDRVEVVRGASRLVGEVVQLLSAQFVFISESTGTPHFCLYSEEWRELEHSA